MRAAKFSTREGVYAERVFSCKNNVGWGCNLLIYVWSLLPALIDFETWNEFLTM